MMEAQDASLLTCIILTYKQKNYLFDCINSVLGQNYHNIELIVTDDGSPDFNKNRIIDYIDSNKKNNISSFSVIHHESNVGTVRNINNAIKCSKGKYIKIIGGDDFYPSNDIFGNQVDGLENEENSFISIGMSSECDSDMNKIIDTRVDKGNDALDIIFDMSYIDARKYIEKHDIFPIVTQAMCFKKEFFDRYGLYDEDYYLLEDAPQTIKVLNLPNKPVVIHKYTITHRANVGISTSKEFFSPRRVKYYKDMCLYYDREVAPCKEVYSFIHRLEKPRVARVQYYMALSKTRSEHPFKRFIIGIKYIDTIIYYAIFYTKKFVDRIKYRFSKQGGKS